MKFTTNRTTLLSGALLVALAPFFAGCEAENPTTEIATDDTAATDGAGNPAVAGLEGDIAADGSSTVFPITSAVAEEFRKDNPNIRIAVSESGTGGGFKKFTASETILQNASRPIKPEEAEAATKGGVEYIELPVAYDGISVVTNESNNWVDCLTTEQLKKIWDQGSKVSKWNEIDPKFPARDIKLYGPGTDSGTFDYFTDEINGEEGQSRSNFTASEDDNVLVQGVSRDPGGLGYFGYAYYEQNADKLKAMQIDAGNGCVAPSAATIASGEYAPLSRPIFIYVSKKAAERPEVKEFVTYYLKNAKSIVPRVGYVPLPDEIYDAALARFEAGTSGSVYAAEGAGDKSLGELYGASGATTEAAPAS